MTHKPTDYPFTLQPIPAIDGGGWLVTWPDLPDCFSSGDTIEDAIRHGMDAATSYLEILAETDRPIPAPGSAANLHLPDTLERRITSYAKDVGVTADLLVNDWLTERIRATV